jgi:Sulfotransferase domain
MMGRTRNAKKVFCLSFQRTGTTSVGQFFHEHGYRTATWQVSRRNGWGLSWFQGDHERIFGSRDFRWHDVFEDGPWFCLDFYKVLFHRFPAARFVLLERDPDRWFDSMLSHSGGRNLGNTHRHAVLYRREEEFQAHPEAAKSRYTSTIDNLFELNESHREHYTRVYRTRNEEVRVFFGQFGPKRLFHGRLEDPKVWHAMGKAFGIDVAEGYAVHANASATTDDASDQAS